MKVSNLEEVGQMRRSNGTSMNRMTNEHTLKQGQSWFAARKLGGAIQANNAKRNNEVDVEDVGDAECEAQHHAQNSSPRQCQQTSS
jgi:hypothetical protein